MTHKVDTVWYTRCPDPTPLGLAARLGWIDDEFAHDDFAVRTMHEVPDPSLQMSYVTHHQRYSIRQGGNVPALWAKASGADTRLIGLSWADEYQAILTLPDSPIQQPADLRGARLALPVQQTRIDQARAGALHGFLVALQLGDVAEAEVTFVPIAVRPIIHQKPHMQFFGGYGVFAELVEALVTRQVDAIYVKGAPGIQAALKLGAHEVIDLRRCADPNHRVNNAAPRPITVDSALLRERPDVVVRFLRRIADVGYWAPAHAAETVHYVGQETDAAPEIVRAAYGRNLHLYQRLELSTQSVTALDYYKRFLVQRGFLPRDFDLDAWIDPAPLTEVGRSLQLHYA
ncbi:ABC transporter substrate-binding protein [Amantichitinum ursilacus]|uniref:2'-hydroxybiphenyl-2-sulfinate desulfinase n=1 Tax=Amantichitinum ursilacus TaxID=857265 RepID=A0A0N0XI13_9NEIS|nr:ABC transporter substrate-binding protein [Amantichitinum ursilacus]KPC49603.1 2'-hydroxybiphenyl-2-sulfinate desulfinase [Amantichitinum ursilacus]